MSYINDEIGQLKAENAKLKAELAEAVGLLREMTLYADRLLDNSNSAWSRAGACEDDEHEPEQAEALGFIANYTQAMRPK